MSIIVATPGSVLLSTHFVLIFNKLLKRKLYHTTLTT